MLKDVLNNNEEVTPNSTEIAILKEHFPSCFQKDGSFDLERFKDFLNDKITITNEGYELKFLGKNYARLLASLDTTTVIKPNEEHNSKPENKNSENIYISGDNLDGLKHLLKSYSGRIKCIYIDPPYNTGADGFVYNDKFDFSVDSLSQKLSISEERAERILDLTRRGSASHSAWLMFMYPRLLLARDLLTNDGVIFISIDDNECHNLKLLCDDVFGGENFVASIIWEKVHTRKNSAKYFSESHDYVLCIARNKEFFNRNLLPREETKAYSNPDNDSNGPWKADPIYANNPYDADYIIEKPNGVRLKRPNGRYWRYSKDSIDRAIKEGRIIWGEGDSYPMIKRYLSEVADGLVPVTLFDREFAGDNMLGNDEVKKLFGAEKIFSYPKPTRLIKRLMQIGSSHRDFIVDFFSGSATSADAIMQLNAEDGGERRYIMIQLPEVIEEGKPAYEAGYKTVDQIGMDRIVKAAAKIKEENPDTNVDLGFKHFVLEEPTANTLDKIEIFDPDNLELFADKTLLEEFGKSTILATWLTRDGYGLSAEPEELDLSGYTGYFIGKHLYLIDAEIPNGAIEDLVVRYETDGNFNAENIVLFGYSFTWREMEQLKINLKRIKNSEKNLNINFDVRY